MKTYLMMIMSSALFVGACSSSEGASNDSDPSGSSASSASGGAGGAGGGESSLGGGGGGGAAPVDTTLKVYEADDPNIQYSGRIDFSDPKKPRFSAPGVYVTAKFKGSSVSVKLKDEHKWGTYFNYYDVVIDDAVATKLKLLPDVTEYEVASDLPYGEHVVTVTKRTEAAVGSSEFLGFAFGGQILEPPTRPSRRIEFIGDSISCGSGNEAANNSPQCSEDGWGQPYHNAYFAFGPVTARQLSAEYHVTAVSGIGLVRNYSSMYDARPMPEVYDLTFVELMDSPAWDRARFTPDAVVITLGTNDFSPGDSPRPKMDPKTYANAYIGFVNKVRGYYPDAHIFCVSSPMLGDGWPEPTDASATDLKTSLTAVEDHFAALGDAKVHKFFVSRATGEGCGTHPSVAEHSATAAELAPFIRTTMGW